MSRKAPGAAALTLSRTTIVGLLVALISFLPAAASGESGLASHAASRAVDPSCGADLAMVVDSSSSVDADELGLMQDAFSSFVAAFLPTSPTEMAVVDFDRRARVLQEFTDDPVALETALNAIESGGRTNWQDGLLKARELFPNRDEPDIIVFASDGRPNKVNGSKEFNRKAALEAAIIEADAAKAAGARIIAIGIGDRLRTEKLEAIASTPADVHTTDFDTLAETLADLADDLCGGTITVTKLIDADGDLSTADDQAPAEGWTFTASVTDGSAEPESDETDSDGEVVFQITGTDASVDITETLGDQYTLLDASCSGATDDGTSNGIDAVTGIVVGNGDQVTCVFINASEVVGT